MEKNSVKKMKLSWFELEPKRNNRFIVEFPKETDIVNYAVNKIDKPKWTNGVWSDINIELIDLIGPSTSQGLFKLIKLINSKTDKTFPIEILSLDPIGNVIEKWLIVVKELFIDFGSLDYGNDGIQRITMKITPKTCGLLY